MPDTQFAHQLVMRRDSSSGLVCVGWARDMPLARFTHIEVVLASAHARPLPLAPDDDGHIQYERACHRARALNAQVLAAERDRHLRQGWRMVPLDLHNGQTGYSDPHGSYQAAAMQALHRLTRNVTGVWAALHDETVCDLCARTPPRPMQAVEYQVWKQQMLKQLQETSGMVKAGKLVVSHSGLWFMPQTDDLD